MNKRILAGFFLVFFLGSFKPAVGMYGKVLCGVKALTGGSLIAAGAKLSYEGNKVIQKPVEGEPMPAIVQDWVRAELRKLNVPDADTVPLLQNESGWAVVSGKAIQCSGDQAINLEYALKTKQKLVSEYEKCWQDFENYSYVRRMLSQKHRECWELERHCDLNSAYCNRVIEHSRASVKHECKHYVNQDVQGMVHAFVAIPVMVQAGCSTVTYGFNKLLNIQPPKTVLQTLLRSAVSINAMVPKAVISVVGGVLYTRHQEREADRFACEHAESRLELSEGVARFREMENAMHNKMIQDTPSLVAMDEKLQNLFKKGFEFIEDWEHPFLADRIAMRQKYLDKWDAEHKA